MDDGTYRIQGIKPANTGYGALAINIIPAADVAEAATASKLEVGDYIVIHKDNGPPEEN
jgi:hypothetical protein